MSFRCQICGKGKVVGRTGRHKPGVAGGQWKKRAPKTVKVFKPNLQWATIGGKRMKLCAKCLKKIKTQSARRETKKDTPL
ncbi:50S ribosomal protein L28 [Candidatus Shapirobacteria bacterium]|nr:50S ribosomal protein L28 [Candidatus Shapirobacteria bacterium]